jgi:hypothetical protein
MKNEDLTASALEQVDPQRRGFLQQLLTGGAAAAALPVMSTVALGAGNGQGAGKGKGGKGLEGKGGKGKGEGGPPDPAKMAAMLLQKFDRDGDKALNERELTAALTEMAKRRSEGGQGKGKGAGEGKGKGAAGGGQGKGKGGGKGKGNS